MIDLKTGRFVLREGVELYPGMTRDDFFKSPLYETELLDESDKKDLTRYKYFFKVQNIDGFQMRINISISLHDYICKIEMTKPEFYKWPNWPKDISEKDYAYSIKKYNDTFLESQIKGSIEQGRELWFDYEWGSITSSISLMHTPNVMLTIRYSEIPFLKAKGKVFRKMTMDEMF